MQGQRRWHVVGLLFLAILINYVDRGNLSIAAVPLMKDFALSPTQMGLLLSAFFCTYAGMQIPAGILIDRYGIRRIYGVPAEELDPEAWSEVAYNLGQGLRNLTVICAPDVIVLAGSVALGGGAQLLAGALQVLHRNVRIVPIPQVRLSTLGPDSALIGAATVARLGYDPVG